MFQTKNLKNKKHPFIKFKRQAKLTYLKIMRIDDPPERIARGAAIGVCMGIFPTFGLGIILSIAFAFIFRANKAAAILGSFIMNPLTIPFFWSLSVIIGSLITGQDSSVIFEKFRGEGALKGAGWASVVFLIGNGIVTAVFTAASYYLVRKWIIRHRLKKAEKMGNKTAPGF